MGAHGAVAPRGIQLPHEIIAKILSDPDLDEQTLKSVMRASKAMFLETIRYTWACVSSETQSIEKLLRVQGPRRQCYADAVQNMTIILGPAKLLPPLHGINFPRLKDLFIGYDDQQQPRQPPFAPLGCHITISHMMYPSLQQLVVAKVDPLSGLFSSGNFLPALARNCPELRVLGLDLSVTSAGANDLTRVIDQCKKLHCLDVSMNAGPLIDEYAFKHIASHCSLRKLRLRNYNPSSFVRTALFLNGSTPFQNLSSVELRIEAAAALMLLPHLHKVETLYLWVIGNTNFFSRLSRLTNLKSLTLDYDTDYSLTNEDVIYLIPLIRLNILRLIRKRFPACTLSGFAISMDTWKSVLPHLTGLTDIAIFAKNNWQIEVLHQFSHNCRKLQSLIILGTYDFATLRIIEEPLFPELVTCGLQCINDFAGADSVKTRAAEMSKLINRHAPKLQRFFTNGSEFSRMVLDEWKKSYGPASGRE